MKPAEKIKSFWASRKPRERVMLVCCTVIVAALWFTLLSNKNSDCQTKLLELTRRAATAELSKSFDPSKTLSDDKFQAEIDRCARAAGVEYKLSSVTSSSMGKFKIYKTVMNISKTTDLSSIMKFESELKALRPYISVAEASFAGDGKGAVSAQYTITSFSL